MEILGDWCHMMSSGGAWGNGAPTFGVLEVLCQQLLCHFEDVDETINGFKALCKPCILENGRTSTVHHAVEKAVPLSVYKWNH